MAQIEKLGNGLTITSTGTQNDILLFTDLLLSNLSWKKIGQQYILTIEVISGSFQFNIGGACTSDNSTLTDGAKLLLPMGSDFGFLNYKAGATSQTFKVSFI